MLRLIGLVVSIGIADSLNPTTIAPALYLGTGEHARRRMIEFTLGVFVVYFLGGVAVALGPGQVVLALIPHPGRHLSYVLEIVAGVAMLTAAAFLWGYRDRLRTRDVISAPRRRGGSSAVLGATITAVEFPTAFPYFAAITAIVTSGQPVLHQIVLILIFNVLFITPLLGMIAILTFAGADAYRLLSAGRAWLERRWPVVLAVLALLAGIFVTLLGVTGFAAPHHNDFGTFSRRLRHILHP
ncbi:MAG: GAP family protein [Actinomycetota bacterium]|nr:GAP family protein [Actinomycetota bacterium]